MADDVLKVLRDQEAATARGDAKAVVAAMAEDVVSYDLPPPLETRGIGEAYVEGLDGWFGTWKSGVTTKIANPTVMIDGDLAVVFGLSRMRGEKSDAGPVNNWNRRTVVLRRDAGQWRIVHDHNSYPLEMDGSGKAATDLQPGSVA